MYGSSDTQGDVTGAKRLKLAGPKKPAITTSGLLPGWEERNLLKSASQLSKAREATTGRVSLPHAATASSKSAHADKAGGLRRTNQVGYTYMHDHPGVS